MTMMEERLSRLEGAYEHLATKSDVANLKAEMAEMKTEMKAQMAELRDEFRSGLATQKIESANLKADLIKWMVGTLIIGIAATATIVRAIA